MNNNFFSNILETEDYAFLETNSHLKDNLILIGLGGSHAYGTNIATSDIDVRGIATRSKEDILLGRDWEQVVNNKTDTTIYSFDKMIKLLSSCNPNTIEMLGLKSEHYLYISDAGKLLLENKDIFISKRAAFTFGGYAKAQLNRLVNKSGRANEVIEQNEARSIEKAFVALRRDGIIDKSTSSYSDNGSIKIKLQQEMDLEDFIKVYQAVDMIHTDYRGSVRNNKAVDHNKLSKHQMHLVRLYLMAFDILEKGEIITYREKDHDFLMDIRNGKYLIDDVTPTKEFMDMLDVFENRLNKARETSELPNKPDEKKIEKLIIDINSVVVTGEK